MLNWYSGPLWRPHQYHRTRNWGPLTTAIGVSPLENRLSSPGQHLDWDLTKPLPDSWCSGAAWDAKCLLCEPLSSGEICYAAVDNQHTLWAHFPHLWDRNNPNNNAHLPESRWKTCRLPHPWALESVPLAPWEASVTGCQAYLNREECFELQCFDLFT